MATKRFNTGGVTNDDLDQANASDDPIGKLNELKGWTESGSGTGDSAPAPEPKKQSFKEAFAEAARKPGVKTFEWNGKKYTTEMAGGASKPAPKAAPVTDTGDDTARLMSRAPAPAKKPAYETPYDRMNRQNRETAAAKSSAASGERETLKKNMRERDFGKGKIDSKTLLPTKGYKSGGSVSASRRADGIAQRGKTRGKMV